MTLKIMDILIKATQLNALSKKKLPFKVSYAISRNKDKFMKEAERYDRERLRLCEVYADKDKDGKAMTAEREREDGSKTKEYIFSAENRQEFEKELNDFRDTELDIDIMIIKPDDLEKVDLSDKFDALSADDLDMIYFMIDE